MGKYFITIGRQSIYKRNVNQISNSEQNLQRLYSFWESAGMDKDSCHWNELEGWANNMGSTYKFIQEKWTIIPSSNTEGTTQRAPCPPPLKEQLRLLMGSQRSVQRKEKCSWITC